MTWGWMTGRGDWRGGLTWRRPGVGGEERKEKRKVEKYLISWATNLQPAQPLALSSLVHWAVALHSGLCHPQVRIESPGHPTVRCGWSRPGCPPPSSKGTNISPRAYRERAKGLCGSGWASRPVFKALAS